MKAAELDALHVRRDRLQELAEPRHNPRKQRKRSEDEDPAHADEVEGSDRGANGDEPRHGEDDVRDDEVLAAEPRAQPPAFVVSGADDPEGSVPALTADVVPDSLT